MAITIARVKVEKIVDLRWRVLRAGLAREAAVFGGDELETSQHFAAIREGEVVGCLTLHLSEWEGRAAYQLRGMATDESVWGTGVGRRLMEAAEEYVRGTKVGVMWCNARVPAVGFYEGAGWRVVSEVFEIPTAGPPVRMVQKLR